MAQLLDGVMLIDAAGTILSANAAALRMHGIASVGELGSTAEGYAERFLLRAEDGRPLKHREYPLFRLLAGDSFPDLVVQVASAGEEETRWVHRVRDVTMDEDGGDPDYLALVISDVSERFDAEVRFKAMFRANPAPAIVVRQHDQRIVQVNPGFLALTGFGPADVTGRTLFGLDLLGGLADPATVASMIDAGGLYPTAQSTEFRVTDGRLLTSDGPYAEAKEVVGGYAIIEARSPEEALAGARRVAEIHVQHWPGWEGAVEVRRISGPEEGLPARG